MLNEPFHDNENLSHFRTVGDWDRDAHDFEQDMDAGGLDYTPEPYQGTLYGKWGRCVVDGRFAYTTLSMVHWYVANAVADYGDVLIDSLVPHFSKAKEGQHTAGDTNGGIEEKAAGPKDLHTSLRNAMFEHIRVTERRLADEGCANPNPQVWLLRDTKMHSPSRGENCDVVFHCDAVFLNPEALDRTRWTSFLSDIATMAGDEADLAAVIAQEKQTLHDLINALYAELTAETNTPNL